MVGTLRSTPPVSGRTVERALAVALLALLATYAVGTLVESSLPALHDAGVVAVHLAAALALVLPLAVVVHGLVGAASRLASAPRLVEFATAAAALVSATVLLWFEVRWGEPAPAALGIVAAAGVLVLAGLFLADYGTSVGTATDRDVR